MVGKPNTWWGSHTWWAAHIHGGLAIQQASFGGGPGWMGPAPGGRAGPAQGARPPGPHPTWPRTKAGLLAGQATMYVGCPPWMASPPCIWLPHHVFGSRVSGIQIPDVQISRYPDIRYQIPDIRYQKNDVKVKKQGFSPKVKNKFQRIGQIRAMVHWTSPET